MAIAVIGGLLVSTVLSLVFVPSFYTVMDDVGRVFGWIFGRFVGPADEPDAAGAAHAGHGAPPLLLPADAAPAGEAPRPIRVAAE
jgi:HAE1 family hydrophobic/amphiphilic exporter-1